MTGERVAIFGLVLVIIYTAFLQHDNVARIERLQKINAEMSGHLAGFRSCAVRNEVYNEVTDKCQERFPMECSYRMQWKRANDTPKEDTTFTWHLQKGSMFLLNNPGVENGNNSTDAGFDVKASGPAAFVLSPTSVAEIGWCTCRCSRPTAQSKLEGNTKPVYAEAVWSPGSARFGW